MRKFLLINLTFIIIFSISSCSKAENNVLSQIPTSNTGLPNTIRKISEITYYNGQTSSYMIDYVYENNILKYLISGTTKVEYIYSGDKIIKSIVSQNNIINTNKGETISYIGNNPSSFMVNNGFEKTDLTYNQNLVISEKNYSGNISSWNLESTKNYTWDVNLNIEQIVNILNNNPNNFQPTKTKYEHDNKNSPMKNMNPNFRHLISSENFNPLDNNNITKRSVFYDINSTTTSITNTQNYILVYNSNNFPIEIKKYSVDSNGLNLSLLSLTTIEYN
jgi:hypothetical protein